jgi:hypothetical protein
MAPRMIKNAPNPIKGLTFFVFINLDYRKHTKRFQTHQSIGPSKLALSLS